MEKVPKKEKDPYAFSAKLYFPKCALAYLISIITTGAYLAKLTTAIGISDGITAMLASIGNLACFFQFASIPLSYRSSSKGAVIVLTTLNQLLYSFLYLIPFMGFSVAVNSAIFFICILSSMIMNQMSGPLSVSWFFGLMRPEERGAFSGVNQMVSHVFGLTFSFAASTVADKFTEAGNLEGMFITFSVTILVLNALHFVTLLLAKEKPRQLTAMKHSMLSDFKTLLKIRPLRKYLIFSIVYAIGAAAASPFFGTYQIRELGLSMTEITIISTVTAVSAIAFLPIFGNYARRHSLTASMKIGLPIMALAYIFIALCTPKNGLIMFIIYWIVATFGCAAFSIGIDAILFEMVAEDQRTTAIAMKNIIAGPLGFLTTTALTPLLNYIQGNGNKIFGIHIYGQQLFAVFSMIILGIASIMFFNFAKTHNPVHQHGDEVKDRV